MGESMLEQWSGFYKLSLQQRLEKVKKFANLTDEEVAILLSRGPMSLEVADKISENVIGTISLPLAIAPNFIINSKEILVPMAIEEPSVVAAASHGAKLAAKTGGFKTSYSGSIMIGQIQLSEVEDIEKKYNLILEKKKEIVAEAKKYSSSIEKYGGGVQDCYPRIVATSRGKMLVVEFLIDVVDSMGANTINTILENTAPYLQQLVGGKIRLRILSNLCLFRVASAVAVWKAEDCGGEEGIEAILDCWALAMSDPFRRATHNKGVMNGVDAVLLACGQDWRAVEAAAHTYSALKNGALTFFQKNASGDLEGKILLPLAVGVVGGTLNINPTAKICLKILGVQTAGELAQVLAAVGLAQNFAALRALALEGIQKGHMKLHARHLALSAQVPDQYLEKVIEWMIANSKISIEGAKEGLEAIKKEEKI
ncbi:MAG: hydroxymethylglutaryl-CoA reductase, degradative [Candidatus Micrarchaeota archaeon]|nr:hydroxymethylglutaryl-CoA reductase, degradative [Candidatus Micrarchaeota archaeon]